MTALWSLRNWHKWRFRILTMGKFEQKLNSLIKRGDFSLGTSRIWTEGLGDTPAKLFSYQFSLKALKQPEFCSPIINNTLFSFPPAREHAFFIVKGKVSDVVLATNKIPPISS